MPDFSMSNKLLVALITQCSGEEKYKPFRYFTVLVLFFLVSILLP